MVAVERKVDLAVQVPVAKSYSYKKDRIFAVFFVVERSLLGVPSVYASFQ